MQNVFQAKTVGYGNNTIVSSARDGQVRHTRRLSFTSSLVKPQAAFQSPSACLGAHERGRGNTVGFARCRRAWFGQ